MSELPLLAPTESDQGVHNANNQILRGALADIDETIAPLAAGDLFSDNFRQDAWTVFTPTVTATTTAPTLGTGSQASGAYARLADRVIVCRYFIRFGTAGVAAGSGIYFVSVPVPTSGFAWGSGSCTRNATGAEYPVSIRTYSSTTVWMNTTASPGVAVGSATPFAWAASDYMLIGGITYEATS